MHHSFKLKYPKGDKETLIYFTSFFKNEGKSFIYSTGERIHPNQWDFKDKQPINLHGRDSEAKNRKSIKNVLSKYSNKFIEVVNRYKTINDELTREKLKDEFNVEFKNSISRANDFFSVYDAFLSVKRDDQSDSANSESTIKRYEYNKTLLELFVEKSGYNLRLNTINKDFYNSFIKFCVELKKHSANTLARNIGLFKTFMIWAYKNNYTYDNQFKEFKNIKRFATDEIALTLDQVKEIYVFDLKENEKLIKIRDLFVMGCSTGLRFGNYSKIKKSDIRDGFINVIDVKDKNKSLSIPLNKFSTEILEKYDYQLPQISNQKFNDYVKDLFKLMEYTEVIKKTMRYGNEIVETTAPVYKRISSHTARRTFITVMKNKNVPDKVIMSYTGHKSLPNFIMYYKPNEEQRINFMEGVWN